jgi:hypothetical protein
MKRAITDPYLRWVVFKSGSREITTDMVERARALKIMDELAIAIEARSFMPHIVVQARMELCYDH